MFVWAAGSILQYVGDSFFLNNIHYFFVVKFVFHAMVDEPKFRN